MIAGQSAGFLQAFVDVGLIPDCGGTYYLPRLVGAARANALTMLGEKISATQAAEWGMIWKTVPDDQLMAEARAVAKRLASGPSVALGLIKQALQVSRITTSTSNWIGNGTRRELRERQRIFLKACKRF